MRSTDALLVLQGLGVSWFSTNDAGAALDVEPAHASQILRRLTQSGHLLHLARCRWALPSIKRLALVEALASPAPSYVSLHSALYHHGLIEQISEVVYGATLAPTRRVTTPLCAVSLHQLAPEVFGDFEYDIKAEANIATPEKALVDFLYLRPARSSLFRALPEVELPDDFDVSHARQLVEGIPSVRRRGMTVELLEGLL